MQATGASFGDAVARAGNISAAAVTTAVDDLIDHHSTRGRDPQYLRVLDLARQVGVVVSPLSVTPQLPLDRRFGFHVYAFAYPNGEYTEREAQFARQAGYRCALAVGGRTNGGSADLYALRRITVDDHDGIDELVVKASGVWPWLERVSGRRRQRSKRYGAYLSNYGESR